MIRELKQKGWTISAIARETGFDRKTIRKHLDAEAARQSKRRSKLDPYKSYLLEYCGQKESSVRSLEPPFAGDRASECGSESHPLEKNNNKQPLE